MQCFTTQIILLLLSQIALVPYPMTRLGTVPHNTFQIKCILYPLSVLQNARLPITVLTSCAHASSKTKVVVPHRTGHSTLTFYTHCTSSSFTDFASTHHHFFCAWLQPSSIGTSAALNAGTWGYSLFTVFCEFNPFSPWVCRLLVVGAAWAHWRYGIKVQNLQGPHIEALHPVNNINSRRNSC
jgi:hypothetical protein